MTFPSSFASEEVRSSALHLYQWRKLKNISSHPPKIFSTKKAAAFQRLLGCRKTIKWAVTLNKMKDPTTLYLLPSSRYQEKTSCADKRPQFFHRVLFHSSLLLLLNQINQFFHLLRNRDPSLCHQHDCLGLHIISVGCPAFLL